jgi:hypothetical protein
MTPMSALCDWLRFADTIGAILPGESSSVSGSDWSSGETLGDLREA